MHGGGQQLKDPTDPTASGRRPVTGLYSKYLRGEFVDDYAAAAIGELDEELRIARSYLAWAIRKHQADPTGGAAVSCSIPRRAVTMRLWADVVMEFLDRIGRLEVRRLQLSLAPPAPDDDSAMDDYRTWLAATGRQSAPPSIEPPATSIPPKPTEH